ncbi:MAG TPA: hypothetical protein PLC08_06575 [Candidatus Bipolaricaulis sp.]|nr:hypothetical protein [Candidatus Bipolaricaulis sp.]
MTGGSAFLRRLFDELERQGVTYCVLRNYDGLPDTGAVGTDIDFWVAPAEGRRFLDTAFQIAQASGWKLVGFLPRIVMRVDGNYYLASNDAQEVINLDIYTSLHWKGIPYLTESVVAGTIREHERGFHIAGPEIEVCETLLRKLLSEGSVPLKYRERIVLFFHQHKDMCIRILERPFGKRTITKLGRRVASGAWAEVERQRRELRWKLFLRSLARHPLSTLASFFSYVIARGGERLRPQWGAFVVLIGPDGAGKTTAAQNLLQTVSTKRLFSRRIYLYRRFPLFPELKVFVRWIRRRRTAEAPASTENLEEVKPFGRCRCMLYVVYYGVEYMLGRLWLWWQFGKNRALVVSDRYFHEYLLQRQFQKTPRWLLALFMRLIAQPDALIYLRTDPKTAYLRKGERSIQELQRQCALFEQWASSTPNGYIVESTSEEQTLLDIQRIVVEVLTRKQRKVVARLISTYHGGQHERRC